MICIGHRGAMGYLAENTLESFELAIKQNVNSIELDITKIENQAIVFHDLELKRLCGIDGHINNLSLNEVSKLKVDTKYKIPFLREVLDLVRNRVGINIELKSSGSAEVVSRVIKDSNYDIGDLLISSFNHKELIKIKKLIPQIKIGALQVSIPIDNSRFAKELNAYSVHPSIEFIDQEFVNDAHANGLKVFAFTANTQESFDAMRMLNVDGVFTNYPDLFFKTNKRVNTKF